MLIVHGKWYSNTVTWDKSLSSVPFGFRIANREPNPLLVLVQVLAVLQVLGSGFAESATNWKSRRTECCFVADNIKFIDQNTSYKYKWWHEIMGRAEGSQSSKESRRALDLLPSVKRRLRGVTRASASRALCHVLPFKNPRRGFDGKFIRPMGRPPVDGFVWDAVAGFWIPRGAKREVDSPPKKMDASSSEHSNESEDDFENNDVASMWSNVGGKRYIVGAHDASQSTRELPTIDDNKLRAADVEAIKIRAMKEVPKLRTNSKKLQHGNNESHHRKSNARSNISTLASKKIDVQLPQPSGDVQTAASCDKSDYSRLKVKKGSSVIDRKPPIEFHNDRFHQDSMWQEPKPLDGSILTLYERHRKPRPVPTRTYKCSFKALTQEFRCVICLGFINNARVVKECLHRFCEQCIEKALIQVGRRNECPICRVFIPTRRSLAPDPNFDKMIQYILKDKAFEDDNESTEAAAIQVAESRARILQEAIRKKRLVIAEQRRIEAKGNDGPRLAQGQLSTSVGENDLNNTVPTTDVSDSPPVPVIVKIVLRRHESEKSLAELRQPFLTISGSATVKLLRHFLGEKLGCSDCLQVCTPTIEGKLFVYRDWKTLEEIAVIAAKANVACDGQYVTIHYRVAPKIAKPDASKPIKLD